MYELRFYNETVGYYVVTDGPFTTPSEAAPKRIVNGELVVDIHTGVVSSDDSWLFPWEREDEETYARKNQGKKKKGHRRGE